MLTGDKLETAINIGTSSGLLKQNDKCFIVDSSDIEMLLKDLKSITDDYNKSHFSFSIVITGLSLLTVIHTLFLAL